MPKKTVLIADDDEAMARAVALRCRELGVDAMVSPDGLHAYGFITRQPPDLLILDLNMPGANGLNMCEELARDERFAPIPVIILTGDSDQTTLERCERLGAHCVWKGLETWNHLKPVVCKLLGLGMPAEGPHPHAAGADSGQARTPPQPPWPKVLVVDDDPAVSKAIKIRLQAYGVEVLRAFNAMQGYWTALKETPNVIVLDYRMPGGYGNFLLCKLQSHPLTEKIPAIVLTGQKRGRDKDYFLERELLCLGASAFLNKPLDFDALLNELRRYIRLEVYQGPTPPRPARV